MTLKKGQKAPDFTLRDPGGNDVSLSDFEGSWVVLYFYPRDNTPGCTKEAIDFSSLLPEFEGLGAKVIGISPDSEKSHERFVEKHKLKVLLLSDPSKKVLKEYGAWGKKKNYGREYEGVIRTTFLINPKGEIVDLWKNVRVRQKRKGKEIRHADVVLDALKSQVSLK